MGFRFLGQGFRGLSQFVVPNLGFIYCLELGSSLGNWEFGGCGEKNERERTKVGRKTELGVGLDFDHTAAGECKSNKADIREKR